jgi:hypothetical protein
LNTVEPASAIVIGIVAFSEHIVHSPGAVVLEALAAMGVIAGVIVLARTAAEPGGADVGSPGSPPEARDGRLLARQT